MPKKQAVRKSKYSLSVKRSKTGLGLFTNDYIKRGSFIIEYFGPIITNEEADKNNGRYLFELNSRWTVDGISRKNIARYINHSCRPNCEADVVRRHIFIYAKRNIKPGEELSYDYGRSYFNDYIKPYGCKCPKCLEKKAPYSRHHHIKTHRSYKKSA
ncbi:MAG: SET domain-containing protein-lysine N-methyltransferase [Candidatus Niyogibacteria bacterium CG10_big_fil_rev_8_21_14_0_10_46_36]|uniref:SET domain-containing protein-lysine N-methyltransferase n=1 Tax=Candidatus Niyogibacteria bacterium CG10_big_fil_rev_8_21_14_0_10_46_36 TaxID=1974726 RepID=A0A2H0TDW2_9BACT|nr:MAG: SET domain-containing protein-lysine N-methyltransferase [Candidatus Niyogibacteria bacterium CG10_big_fil_rev_8_21_14_0_10_46_36]